MLTLSDKVVPAFAVPAAKDYTNFVLGKVFAPAEVKQEKDHIQWTKALAKDSMEFLARRRGEWLKKVETEARYHEATAKLVQEISTRLGAYSSEFNHAIGWKDLFVTMTEPSLVTEVIRYNKFREPIETLTTFRARLSTRHMALVIKGKRNQIEFMLMPVEKVIGLSKAEQEVTASAVLEAKHDEETDQIEWFEDEETLDSESIDRVLKSLFTALIHETRDQAAAVKAA